MWINSLKKITSFFLIFFLLFGTTFRIPVELFLSSVSAGDKEFVNLVSILVDEESYSEAKGKIIRYSRDIQNTLENTRVVILPTPNDASVLDIASLNESLYFEGYKSLKNVNYESRLIGTVLVGKVPVPVVFDGDKSAKSILPYVDFDDKAYIYDHSSEKYEKSDNADENFAPEVWHGVISPNTGEESKDIKAIKNYFDKNHDFYTGKGVFDQNKNVLDGQDIAEPKEYEPYVFYYDQFRENKAIQYQSYLGYQMYLQNIEDITYNRYSKDLAKKVSEQILSGQNDEIVGLLQKIDSKFDMSNFTNTGPDPDSSSDVMTRYITNNATKKFLEIFNGSTLGEMRKHVFNAGRYNKGGDRVNMDMPPFLISVLDQVSSQVVKNVNTNLENEITDIVANGLSRKIPIAMSQKIVADVPTCSSTKRGFYYGKIANDIQSAGDCSIYRGNTNSGTLVEANRGYNIKLADLDNSICSGDYARGDRDASNVSQGYWAGNTPLNFDLPEGGAFKDFKLKNNNYTKAIRSIFDITGSKEISDASKIPSPIDCYTDGVLIMTFKERLEPGRGEEDDDECVFDFQAPVLGKTRNGNWSCRTENATTALPGGFPEAYRNHASGIGSCVVSTMKLDGKTFTQRVESNCSGSGEDRSCTCPYNTGTIEYKTIPSYILHTSPTDEEYGAQIKALFTPSLPIDKNRYIDFIGAKGGDAPNYGYQKIDFPALFRVSVNQGEDVTLENVEKKVKEHLDDVSAQINSVIQNADPSSLSGEEKELYDVLSTGEYPEANIDLYASLKSKNTEIFTLDNQSKEISYYDTLVFAVYWNNLTTVAEKYKFIFQNYLSNQFEGNEYGFHLPKSKKSYETSYLAAPGDAQNMYIKMDPEMKGIHPYADILAANLNLNTTLIAANIDDPENEEPTFECAPPDGVNIFQWIPAIICWLKNMLPPKIKIGTTNCGSDLFTKEQEEEIKACSKDENNNGINDCLEKKLAGGSILLSSDVGRYYYHTPGSITSEIYDNEKKLAFFDSNSYVKHDLIRLDIPKNSEEEFKGANIQTIYDRDNVNKNSDEDYKNAQKYIAFNTSLPRAQRGKAKTYFYSRGQDVNAYFESNLVIKDVSETEIVNLTSNELRVEVRGDRMLVGSFKVERAGGEYFASSELKVSDQTNVCLADVNGSLTSIADEAFAVSDAPEKILFTLENISKAGNNLALSYPLDIELWRDGELALKQDDITQEYLKNNRGIFTGKQSGEYTLKVRDANDFVAVKTLDVYPDTAKSMNLTLGSTILESGGNISTHFVSLLDQYGNIASNNIHLLDVNIEGDGAVFAENGEKSISYTLAEGYKAFRLKTTDDTGNITLSLKLRDYNKNLIASSSGKVQVVDDIKVRVTPVGDTPKVGGGIYSYKLAFTDSDGNIFKNLNSRVYLGVEKLYGRATKAYVEIISGEAEVSFKTSTLAARNIFLELQLEGGNEIYKEYIDILPEKPIRMDLALSRSKIEASRDDSTILEATLKDRYNNDVFTDSSTQLNLEIEEKSVRIIAPKLASQKVKEGKAKFTITGTSTPGIGYFKVSSNPDLSQNSFTLYGQNPFLRETLTLPSFVKSDGTLSNTGKAFFSEYGPDKYLSRFPTKEQLVLQKDYKNLPKTLQNKLLEFWESQNTRQISGLGENAGHIETFYFWKDKEIQGNAYNGMYSVLLGAQYGDITKENYLGGSLLFDRDNSALAVTTLLNNPYTFSDILSIEKNAGIRLQSTRDLTQDIELQSDIDPKGRLFLDIHNEALENYIGRVYYDLSSTNGIELTISDDAYKVSKEGESTVLRDVNGQSIFEIGESGTFKRKRGSYLEFHSNYSGKGISLGIMHNNKEVAKLIIERKLDVQITRNAVLVEGKLSLAGDILLLHLASNSYSSREQYTSDGAGITKVYYHDPFASKNRLSNFHEQDVPGLEASYDESGIGWQDPNMMLLAFSAGESVGDASRKYQSFSMVNLGDPVLTLKDHATFFPNSQLKKSFDSTIGDVISGQEDIITYGVFDYNKDAKKDIITVKKDGYISLLEGADVERGFISQRDLVYAADLGTERLIKVGDFTGDGYGDIFFVSDSGTPELFNNHQKDFYRYPLEEQISLSGAIIQAEVFDMDSDGKDDITMLDDSGEIHIFYGGGDAETPSFTKKFIGDGYNIKIVETSHSYGGAIYFDGLTQIDPDNQSQLTKLTQDYLKKVQEAIDAKNPDEVPVPKFINDSLVSSLVYVGLPYVPTSYDTPEINGEYVTEQFQNQIDSLGADAASQGVGETNTALQNFVENYSDYIAYSGTQSSRDQTTYFLRSQYAELEGIEISKIFRDTTPPNLQTGDTVHYDITIKNTSNTLKENVAYVDFIPKYFRFKTDDYILLSEDEKPFKRRPSLGSYNILLDDIFLAPGEEMTVRYELETLPLSYGHMQVGLYEKGEIGDDIYGDIILKESEKNCGREAKIFRSTAVRSYLEGKTVPTCDNSKVEIGNTFPELADEDNNGVPDYLDKLLESESQIPEIDKNLEGKALSDAIDNMSSTDAYKHIQDDAKKRLETLQKDSDNDGIPDSDDTMDNTDSATDFMGALDQINEAIDDIAGEIDSLIEGLSCGFGGGSCFANPLNWAPLAPGNDPTLFGMPIGNGLRVNEGIPVFSALTGRQASCGFSPCCLPSAFPANSQTFIPGPACGGPGAGGSRGVTSPTNFVRMFVTPTLTGGAGIAVCFGGPAIVRGNIPPMGVSPVAPGGNCIVAAMPLGKCNGGEGDPGSVGYPIIGDFGVIHANCDGEIGKDLKTPKELSGDFVKDYFEYLKTGKISDAMYQNYLKSFENIEQYAGGNFTLPSQPLINIGGGEGMMSTSVDLDLKALGSGNFGDVVQVQNKRVGAFPNFLMDWVERQLDEVTSKLTNLPKIYVILPDFGGIFDGSFKDFGKGLQDSFNKGKAERASKRTQRSAQTDAIKQTKAGLDCNGKDKLQCSKLSLQAVSQKGENFITNSNERLSGIKEAYEFIGNIPLVNLETETISVNVPWIDQSELTRFIADWELTANQWKGELKRAERAWSFGASCEGTAQEIAACQKQNDIKNNASIKAGKLISSLERNIEVLEEYKRFPEKLQKLINIKEEWLEQILCNIDAISKLMGEWINTNGERFKAWVELYMLIKAILKSWQLFIDVFNDYEAECHECKNERHDLQNFMFKLISAVIPSPPIIQFPKWPDIILDFHNIRAGMTITMPEFEMNMRPIVLPPLPKLTLPNTPTASLNLPEIPVLPMFEIPELPDLPSLPTIELPDLPPPPKIPKLFGAVEAVLNIAKLVTKVMCILKKSPFVPEWKAGDQIAFLTERNGHLPIDFIDIQPPAFSYSAISAIKVTTYVNLEFEMDFLVEAARAITAPLDKITSNIANMFDIQVSDIDLSDAVPSNVDVNLNSDGSVDTEVSHIDMGVEHKKIIALSGILASGFLQTLERLSKDEGIMLSNTEFTEYMNRQLANPLLVSDQSTSELRNLWSEVQNMKYTQQDELISDLKKHNAEKFDTLKNIISTEIQQSKHQRESLENLENLETFTLTADQAENRFETYNKELEPYNVRTVEAAIGLLKGESEESKNFRADLDRQAKNMMQEVRGGLGSYKEKLLSATTGNTSSQAQSSGGTCIGGNNHFRYEGIYVLEDGKNYKLFDYTDILKGDEIPTIVDLDSDGDEDVLYLAAGKLFFKENTKQENAKSHISGLPLILESSKNKFYNGSIYHEAVNGFEQGVVSDGAINIEFAASTNPEIHNYMLEYHTIVDRYLDETDTFIPRSVQTHRVDGISGIEKKGIISTGKDYEVKKHLATLTYAGAMRGIKLTTQKLVSIPNELEAGKRVVMTSDANVYAGGKDVRLTYKISDEEQQEMTLRKYTQVSFKRPTEIVSISGEAYIQMGILEDIFDTDIIDYIGKPLFADSKIIFEGNKNSLDESSHIDIRYYDGSETFLDMRDIQSYILYDLGSAKSDSYHMRLLVENDFYYARMQSFKDNVYSTYSEQELLAPQVYADNLAPQIGLSQKIRIPVYQKQRVDLTPYIYEDGGISGIKKVIIDFDLSQDSDGDGNPKNDNDANTGAISVIQNPAQIKIDFGPYDKIFTRKISLALEDDNGNIGSKLVDFEVYPPEPSIENIEGNIISGAIDEVLQNEPVRLYRYRGGIIEKLQKSDGSDVVDTDSAGNYDFETPNTASGLVLTYSGGTLAEIDEYTGQITLQSVIASTSVRASNHPDNDSLYPEIQIYRAGKAIFRQYVMMPEKEAGFVSSFEDIEDEGIYVKILDQENYASYRVPLVAPYNPGSVSLYLQSDANKTAIMTIFKDGRVDIDRSKYELTYENIGENMSLILKEKLSGKQVAQMMYKIEASYILK